MVPTTSPPPRRSKSKSGLAKGGPLRSIRLSVTLVGAELTLMGHLASEKGLTMEEKGGEITVTFTATSPEEALAQLKLLSDLLAQKP